MALPVQINPKHNKSTLERVCFYYGEIFIRGCLRGCIGGCIVELYQFRCSDESLSLRFLSRQRTLSLYGPADQAVYGESVGADIGSD